MSAIWENEREILECCAALGSVQGLNGAAKMKVEKEVDQVKVGHSVTRSPVDGIGMGVSWSFMIIGPPTTAMTTATPAEKTIQSFPFPCVEKFMICEYLFSSTALWCRQRVGSCSLWCHRPVNCLTERL